MASAGERRLRAADTAPGSENQLTIEQLAQRMGLSVRNVRSHHARGLLPPPEVRSRVGYYGPAHEARLRLIRELQDEGLKLEGVKRLLDETHSTGEGLLRVKEAAEAEAEREQPEVLSAVELAQRFDVDGETAAKLLRKAQKLSILSPMGDDLYEVPSPSLLAAADETQRVGIELEHAVEAIGEVERHSTAVARRFVKLFLDDVWKPFAQAGMPEDQWPAIAEAMERARPIAARALVAVFRQCMIREVDATFADIAKKLSEGKR
ncbi:MAG TPA: MerR family transcriptional regulator [Thermoleophilaceae bacterium]